MAGVENKSVQNRRDLRIETQLTMTLLHISNNNLLNIFREELTDVGVTMLSVIFIKF